MIADGRIEQARARFARIAFAEWLGVTIEELAADRAVLCLPGRPDHLNAGGVLNGGASASLLTMAGTLAAWAGVDLDANVSLGCVDMSMHYLARAGQDDVLALARVLRRGRSVVFLDVSLTSRAGEAIGHGLLSYQTSDHGEHAPREQARHLPLPPPSTLTPPSSDRLLRGYVRKLGITPLHESAGRVRLRMPCTAAHADERGHLHAGAIASLVDIAAVAASWSLVPRREGARGSTIGIQVSYPARASSAVVADAHVHQRSEDLLFSTVHVTAEAAGQLVGLGQVSYRLVEPRPSRPSA